jgi:moderate conductance mechanosensitive channel
MLLENIQTEAISWIFEHGIPIVIVMVGFFIAQRILKTVIHHALDRVVKKTYHSRGDVAMKKRQNTLENVFYVTIKVILWTGAGLMILSEIGLDIAPLLAGAGIAGLAFGFGGQYLVRDIISGLFIIVEDQFRRGDVIEVAGISGNVEDVNLRRTVLRDIDGVEHHIPNGEITTTSNKTKFWSRIHLLIGISYDADIKETIQVLNKTCDAFAKSEKWKEHVIKTPTVIGIEELADSAVVYKIMGDVKPGTQWDGMRELRKDIKIALDQAGIEIPYPHQVNLKK